MATAIAAPSASLPRQRRFLIGLVVFFVAINAQYVFKVHKSDRSDRSAIQRWLPQLHKLTEGENIWAVHNFPFPPVMALILTPLTLLPSMTAALLWFVLKVGMALVAIHLVFAMLDNPDRPLPIWGKVVAVLLSLRPIQGDLVHANINLFILMLVVIALFAFTRGRDWCAGFFLALAIACKVTPALFIPYFLWKRAWKTLAATGIGLALFLFVAPSIFLGWGDNQKFFTSWYGNMVRPFLAEGQVFYSEHPNQSLPGLASRMLTHNPSFADYDELDQKRPLEYHNIADWDPRAVGMLVKACMGLFVLLVIWTCRAPVCSLAARRDWRLVAEFGMVLLGMLLFSERTWKHHCVTLLVPFAVLSYVLATGWRDVFQRWWIVASLSLAMLLMSATSTGLFDRQDRFGKLAQVYGAYVGVFVILLGALALTIVRSRYRCQALEVTPAFPSPRTTDPF